MKAIQLSSFGEPEVLQMIDAPMPAPAAGEVLVRVRVAGVNFFETLLRRGRYGRPGLPLMPGVEAVGIVEQVGMGADAGLLGRRVAVPLFAYGRAGGYAEYLAVGADQVFPIPDGLSDVAASALLVQGLSALLLARHAPVAGKSVLVTSAAGGVGSLLVQLVRRAGAHRIIGLVGADDKLAKVRSLGADFVFNYRQTGWLAQMAGELNPASDRNDIADVLYDAWGEAMTPALLELLAPSGMMVFAALNRCALTAAQLEAMFARNQSLRGFSLLPLLGGEQCAPLREGLETLFALAARGELNILEATCFPLTQAAAAHRLLESGASTGKIVLTIA